MSKPDAPQGDDRQSDDRQSDGQHRDPLGDTTFETTDSSPTDPADDTTQLEQTVHSDTTEQFETTEQVERTEQLDTTDATRAIGVEEPATSRDLFGNPVHHTDTAATAAREDEHVIAPLPERPSGPHAPAIVLGLVCLAVAGIILAQELGDLTVDWGNVGPLGIVLTGAVLVLFGLVGLLTSRRNSKTT